MITVKCPLCQNKIIVSQPILLGQRVTCSECTSPLEVIWLYPVSLDVVETKEGKLNNLVQAEITTDQISTEEQ